MSDSAISLFPRQTRFVTDTRRFPGYVGGIGSGKSFAGGVKAITRLSQPGLGGIFAPTYPMLRDATQRTVLDLLQRTNIRYEHNKSENRVIIPATGHEILFRSLDNPDTVRGPNLHWAWIDEASLVTKEASNVVNGRVRVGSNPQVWKTFTPKGRNWCWEEYERDATGDETDPMHPLYPVKTTENPELPADFAHSLGYTGRFADQELGGEFVAFEGVVYPAFNRSEHVRTINTEGWSTHFGVDVGTRNPTAILTAKLASDGRVHIEREYYRRGMSSDEITDAIAIAAEAAKPETVWADPSANDYILSWRARDIPARKANNDVSFGISVVTTALDNGLTVDPSCVNLIAEFETYHYPANRQESDKPVKEADHALDALRYLLASQPQYVIGSIFV